MEERIPPIIRKWIRIDEFCCNYFEGLFVALRKSEKADGNNYEIWEPLNCAQ